MEKIVEIVEIEEIQNYMTSKISCMLGLVRRAARYREPSKVHVALLLAGSLACLIDGKESESRSIAGIIYK